MNLSGKLENAFNAIKTTSICGIIFLALFCHQAQANDAVEAGKTIYKKACGSCHNGGIKGWVSGAPKAGKDAAWAKYFQNGLAQSKKDIFNGTEKHEAMGKKEGFSQEEIDAAVDYIISLMPSVKTDSSETESE